MRRWLCAAAIVVVCVAWPYATASPQDASLEQLFQQYESGDVGAVVRRLRTAADFDWIHRELHRARAAWTKDWRPMRAVFMLDVATTPVDLGWRYLVTDLVDAARTYVVSRGAPGADRELDAFEVAWHTAILSAMLAKLETRNIETYLVQIENRISLAPLPDRPALIAPHLLLIRAVAHEQVTTPDTIAARRGERTGSILISKIDGQVREHSEEALRLFDHAAAFPGLAAESLVRKGFLLHRLGQHAAALEALNLAGADDGDRSVRYWRELFRGRVLEALDRRPDATTAYEAAVNRWPEAQSPVIALIALHGRDGRRDEAQRWAHILNKAPGDAYDPWWDYWYGDGRFFARRRAALRVGAR